MDLDVHRAIFDLGGLPSERLCRTLDLCGARACGRGRRLSLLAPISAVRVRQGSLSFEPDPGRLW